MQQYQKHQLNKQIFKNLTTAINKENANTLFHDFDKDVPLMLTTTRFAFRTLFDQAFLFYKQGDWPTAHSLLLQCARLKSSDGPTKNLLAIISKAEKTAPAEWKGFRKID